MKKINTIKGKLFVGSKDDMLNILESESEVFDIIWNLADELSWLKPDQEQMATTVILGAVRDMGVPEVSLFRKQLKIIVGALTNGKKVFIHCMDGVGRTGVALAAVQMHLEKLTAKEALQYAKLMCGGPETSDQINFVEQLQNAS